MKNNLEIILFDLNKTLVFGPKRVIKFNIIKKILHENGYNLLIENIRDAYENANIFYDLCAHLFMGNENKLYFDFCKTLLKNFNIPFEKKIIHELSYNLRFHPEILKNNGVYPEVEEVCIELKNKNLFLGVVSTNIAAKRILKENRIINLFDIVLSSADGIDKATQMKLILKKTSKSNNKVLVVGDDYIQDVLIPQILGFTPVLLNRTGQKYNLDCMVISSLDELLKII